MPWGTSTRSSWSMGPKTTSRRAGSTTSSFTRGSNRTGRSSRSSETRPSVCPPTSSSLDSGSRLRCMRLSSFEPSRVRSSECSTFESAREPAQGGSSGNEHLRVRSAQQGSLSVPARSRDDFNLNAVAKVANKAWKDISEESFVETAKTPEHVRRETALEVIKYVIDVKLTEEGAEKKRADNKVEKEKLL